MKDQEHKKRTFFTDIWRKILALILAVFAWFSINKQVSEDAPETTVIVPLRLECSDNQVVLPKEMPLITLKIRSFLEKSKLTEDNFEIKYVVKENYHSIPAQGMKLNLNNYSGFIVERRPPLTKIVSYDIQTTVFIDKIIRKSVPIHVKATGQLGRGLVPQFIVHPENLVLEGPSSKLSQLPFINTQEINIENIKENMFFNLEVELLPSDFKMLSDLPENGLKIELKVINPKNLQIKEMEHVPVRLLSATPQKFIPDSIPALDVKLTFHADIRTISALKNPKPYIDVSDIKQEGQVSLPVQLDLPKNINDKMYKVEIEPPSVLLNLIPNKALEPVQEEKNVKQ